MGGSSNHKRQRNTSSEACALLTGIHKMKLAVFAWHTIWPRTAYIYAGIQY